MAPKAWYKESWLSSIFLPRTGRTDSTRHLLAWLLQRTSILSIQKVDLCQRMVETHLDAKECQRQSYQAQAYLSRDNGEHS